jgi:hypothetical protein
MKDVVVAKNLRFFCSPNSSTLSENILRGGRGGPQTISERGMTAAVERLAGFTSVSGSWSSIVPMEKPPASAPPQPLLNLSRRGMCPERSHLRFSQGHLRPQADARQMALITALGDLNHGFAISS